MLGADVRFVDIDYKTGLLDPERLKNRLKEDNHSEANRFIAPVHYAGLPCDMDSISRIATKFDATVIEDACHAPGAVYNTDDSRYIIGSCGHSEAAVLSFHPVKHFTSGEGGAILTNNRDLADQIRRLRHHGIEKKVSSPDEGPWYYEMRELGVNGRITDFQCALGRSQLERFDEILIKRKSIAERYDKVFQNLSDIQPLPNPDDKDHAFHLYVIRSPHRDKLYEYLQNHDIHPQVHYIPVPNQPYYQQNDFQNPASVSTAQRHYERSLSLPMFPGLTEDEQNKVIRCVKSFLEQS